VASNPALTVSEPTPARCESGISGQGLTPHERIRALCDPGTVEVMRAATGSAGPGGESRDGEGVVGATGEVEGRPVACFAQDGRVAGGAVGDRQAATICRVLHLAARAKVPLVTFVESAGARIQEGTPALNAYARVLRALVGLSGKVPQIAIVTGTAAGGGCYSAELTDIVILTGRTRMFLTGPSIVRAATGEHVPAAELGGSAVHERNGVCQLVATDDRRAATLARRLLSYLPQNAYERPPRAEPRPPTGADPSACVPSRSSRPYDVRAVILALVDGGTMLELASGWARNVVTVFARLEGRAVGVVANQAGHLGGVIDVAASQKAARFVRTCDAFGVPLVVLVDTPGFMPGTRQESMGIIRHGADLLRAFAAARVPRVTLILRQAHGGGYIAMNSKDLGASRTFAWPGAVVGIMGPRLAVGIVEKAAIAAAEDPRAAHERLADSYAAEQQGASVALQQGAIDEVIAPAESRARICGALWRHAGTC